MQLPVTTTLMGLGCFPGTDPLALGMLGMHGTYRANMAVTNCDLLLAVGARFDDRVTGDISKFAKQAEIIHIDIDPTSISKNVPVDIPIVGDAKDILKKLHSTVDDSKKKNWKSKHKSWLAQIEKWKSTHSLDYKQSETIKPQYVVEQLYQLTKGNAIISTEVGQNQMWAAQFYIFDKPRRLLTSGGLGTMGYGFPAAIGAHSKTIRRRIAGSAGNRRMAKAYRIMEDDRPRAEHDYASFCDDAIHDQRDPRGKRRRSGCFCRFASSVCASR